MRVAAVCETGGGGWEPERLTSRRLAGGGWAQPSPPPPRLSLGDIPPCQYPGKSPPPYPPPPSFPVKWVHLRTRSTNLFLGDVSHTPPTPRIHHTTPPPTLRSRTARSSSTSSAVLYDDIGDALGRFSLLPASMATPCPPARLTPHCLVRLTDPAPTPLPTPRSPVFPMASCLLCSLVLFCCRLTLVARIIYGVGKRAGGGLSAPQRT